MEGHILVPALLLSGPRKPSYSLNPCFLIGKMEITDPIGLTDRAVVKIKPQCLALSIDLTFHNYDYFKWADCVH